jgi:hypothetical protein
MASIEAFDPQAAYSQFYERIRSLDADTRRCFWPIPGGPGAALFPPVLYAFATIDYFSSYFAGWNDNRGDRNKKQTVRIVDFMTTYLGYGQRASTVAVNIWRHKLMHTGEPRVLLAKNGVDRFTWATGNGLAAAHMRLIPTGMPNERILCFDSYTIVADLHRGVFGPSGYFHDLCTTPDFQQRFLDCQKEMENYPVDV